MRFPHQERPKIMEQGTETARQIWLAGLGALAVAAKEGGDLFDRLMREGLATESDETALPRVADGSEVAEPPPPAWGGAPAAAPVTGAVLLFDRLLQSWAEAGQTTERLIEAMLPASAVPSASAVLQARRNASARQALLEETGALSSAEVAALAGSKASNKAALANRWKQEGRIFSVTWLGAVLFPGFQFDDEGRPRPVVAEVLAVLETRRSEWEIALWFGNATGYLGGRRPLDLLESDPGAVAQAAGREAEELTF